MRKMEVHGDLEEEYIFIICTNYGGLYTGEYATRCGHSNADDPTTLQEQADYVQYSVEKRITIAKSIFGQDIFGKGKYEENEDEYIYGIYTSSSARIYKEWKQTTNEYGNKTVWDWNMAKEGCGLYSVTMLLNSIGIDVTPEDVRAECDSNVPEGNFLVALKNMLKTYGMNDSRAVSVKDQTDLISKLKDGYGVMIYTNGPSDFTDTDHWFPVVDIRKTELGCSTGYDVYILNSVNAYCGANGWVKLEEINNNLNSYGYCIVD